MIGPVTLAVTTNLTIVRLMEIRVEEVAADHVLLDQRRKRDRPEWVQREWGTLDSPDFDGRAHDKAMVTHDADGLAGFIRFSIEGDSLHIGVIAARNDAARGTGRALLEAALSKYAITSVHGRAITTESAGFFRHMQHEHPTIAFQLLGSVSVLPPPKRPRNPRS